MKTSQKSSASPNRIGVGRQLKVVGSGSSSIASPTSLSRTPKKRSPKVLERGSPQSPMTQKHTPSKITELESQLAQLEDELKKAKEHLISSELLKQRAEQETEETKKQLLVMSARLKKSQQELFELSNMEDSRVKEIQKLSQKRDQVWQSEVEAIQKQHSMDSVALASSFNEIQKLKKQLEFVSTSEATEGKHAQSAQTDIENLWAELSENFTMLEDMEKQFNECKRSEARAREVAREAQVQLEETMKTAESLRFEGLKTNEAYHNLVSELEQSKREGTSLENLVRQLKEDLEIRSKISSDALRESIPKENETMKLEIDELKYALEASEHRYQEDYIQTTLQIRNAYDQVERAKLDSSTREAEFEVELKNAKDTIEKLKVEVMNKETMLRNISEHKKNLSIKIDEKSEFKVEIEKLKEDLENLKVALMGKETQVQNTQEENENLKEEIQKKENERIQAIQARVSEQLEAAETANSELEAELRRLKVQSEQWRKAAEAATTMLSSAGNARFMDRAISLDSSYKTLALKVDSPHYDDSDDESLKRQNSNMLKKIGVLWKKGGHK